jgi:hypothetical protein
VAHRRADVTRDVVGDSEGTLLVGDLLHGRARSRADPPSAGPRDLVPDSRRRAAGRVGTDGANGGVSGPRGPACGGLSRRRC